jgi:hypothetical protein
MNPTGQEDCFAALIAMDGMYAENAGAFFCRKDACISSSQIRDRAAG